MSQDKVLTESPALRDALDQHRGKSIYTYFDEQYSSALPAGERAKLQLLPLVEKAVLKITDSETAEGAVSQLKERFVVSTADHHGPINHPYFHNSHIVQSFVQRRHKHRYIVIFSCGSVSMNNATFPRGLWFTDQEDHDQHINFAGWRDRRATVFAFPSYDRKIVKNSIGQVASRSLNIRMKEILTGLLAEIYADPVALSFQYYADQVGRTNFMLWRCIPGQEDVSLIYLQQEDIVNDVLVTHHLRTHTVISLLLTDMHFIHAYETFFDGIQGAFSRKEGKGTVLFWGVESKRRLPLYRHAKTLQSVDGTFRVELTREALSDAIRARRLMPSMALSFIVLSFYYGLRCGGGYSQVTYLGRMKDAYGELLGTLGLEEERAKSISVETRSLYGGFMLAELSSGKPATTLGLILRQMSASDLRQRAFGLTVNESVSKMIEAFLL